MARVTYGSIITNIRGSIGGTTFQSNKAGKIARNRPTNPKHPKEKQSQSISDFSTLAFEWRQLTLPQQTLWNSFAAANPKTDRNGEVKTLTGYSMFVSVNFWRVKLSMAILTVPVAFAGAGAVTDYTIVLDPLEIKTTVFLSPVVANHYVIVNASLPVTGSSPVVLSKTRLVSVIAAGSIVGMNLVSLYDTALGMDYVTQRAAGQFNISFMFQNLDAGTGETSPALFKTFSF